MIGIRALCLSPVWTVSVSSPGKSSAYKWCCLTLAGRLAAAMYRPAFLGKQVWMRREQGEMVRKGLRRIEGEEGLSGPTWQNPLILQREGESQEGQGMEWDLSCFYCF